jgi:predicted enzyme related to lactoylglutathione lyase
MTGGVVHFEIHVDDIERAKAFYATVFGWEFQRFGDSEPEYWLIETDDQNQGGGILKRNASLAPIGSSPNSFVCTMAVDSVDDTYAAALKAGGHEAMAPTDLPGMGRNAYLIDTEGNIFGLFQGFSAGQG